MQGSREGLPLSLLFAFLAISAGPAAAVAQDMPPILAPLAPAAVAPANPALTSPSAEAVIPPAAPIPMAAPAKPEHVAAVKHPATVHHSGKSRAVKTKFAALMKRLTPAYHARRFVTHVAATREREPSLPPGTLIPPPGYFSPPPHEHLVYGGPPPGYPGWGPYRGRYPYY